uniref:uncharacterized protein LOC120347245 n=1 Tax=Styela clava TaxID=7725 RepID=UPI00193984B4|nr:uncharacterized protein LOC120347245 [Styela clava]
MTDEGKGDVEKESEDRRRPGQERIAKIIGAIIICLLVITVIGIFAYFFSKGSADPNKDFKEKFNENKTLDSSLVKAPKKTSSTTHPSIKDTEVTTILSDIKGARTFNEMSPIEDSEILTKKPLSMLETTVAAQKIWKSDAASDTKITKPKATT